uniref:Glucagon / GIP / secretin / VIP family domain-containing protein n=1 Tax=Ficedula albicollis TaxID=59894 RepID=A0A803VSJ9_FICAL
PGTSRKVLGGEHRKEQRNWTWSPHPSSSSEGAGKGSPWAEESLQDTLCQQEATSPERRKPTVTHARRSRIPVTHLSALGILQTSLKAAGRRRVQPEAAGRRKIGSGVEGAALCPRWKLFGAQNSPSFPSLIKRHSEGTFTSDFTRYLDRMKAKDFVHWLINTKRYN